MKHFSQLLLLPLGSVLLACGVAHAEGNKDFEGAHGVNRVVRSDADADHPRLTTSGHVELSMVQPVNRGGEFDAEVNPFNNKATAYLGGASKVLVGNGLQEFDGGLQFESGVFGNYTRGWTAFISRGNRFVTAHIYRDDTNDNIDNPVDVVWRGGSFSANKDATGKYVAATGSIGSDITFTIVPNGTTTTGITTTTVSAIGVDNNTFIWSPNGNNNANDNRTKARKQNPIAPWGADAYNHANQALATSKRVSAMTRSPGHKSELDGSEMSAAWTNCTLNGGSWAAVVGGNVVSYVDQDRTGYDSPANVVGAWDRRDGNGKTDDSRTITLFSGIAGVTNARARSTIGNIARYTNETVAVNLGTATTLTGDELEWE